MYQFFNDFLYDKATFVGTIFLAVVVVGSLIAIAVFEEKK